MFIQVGSAVKLCHVVGPGSRSSSAAACSSGGSFSRSPLRNVLPQKLLLLLLVVKIETKRELRTKQKRETPQPASKRGQSVNEAFDKSAAEISRCVPHRPGWLEAHSFGTAGKGSWRSSSAGTLPAARARVRVEISLWCGCLQRYFG